MIPDDVLDFIYITQPKEWNRLKERYGEDVKGRFLQRLAREVERRGTLDVLRNGVRDMGCRFELAFVRPASGLNPETERLYEGNRFTVIRQLRYSRDNDKSLDLVLFLNGLPIFTGELKNPLTGQTVQDAIVQYKMNRDPKESLFLFGRCLAYFAVDPDLVYVTTRLAGPKTRFLPFNRGKYGGAGNEPVLDDYPTSYLWKQVWSRDSILNLVQQFLQLVEEEKEGRKTGERVLIFPRYHQLDAVRRLVNHARGHGSGQRYLIQHSAGSGKSYSIAWLAHQLSILHDDQDRSVFDSVVVITDRVVLDRQLQRTVRQFEQTLGVVENIEKTSRQLKAALESGKRIIVTTLQKFPVIVDEMGELPGKRFAVIVDEAHTSQTGEASRSLRAVLAAPALEQAEADEAGEEETFEDRIVAEIARRGRLPNVSYFAFTATPKPKTLELFGTKLADGRFVPFSLYSMRQAIEEGFILDVLQNYTTYTTYFRLLKKVENDPRFDRRKAQYLLRSYVDLHDHAIRTKVGIMVEHFHGQVAHRIGRQAKAMIVTRSRLHAVRYKLVMDAYLKEKGYPYRALVAFSGTVSDGGIAYTESGMNGFAESQTADAFKRPAYRFLIVANKFQTGFDQPLLHTMYVDKKLGGVNAVQTLSRLNRVYPPHKEETMILDFVNEAEEILKAFQPYYERTLLSEGTDPNLVYDLQRDLAQAGVFSPVEVDAFARAFYSARSTQGQIHAALRPPLDRFSALPREDQATFRGRLTDYVRLYAFASQILPFADPDLEKLYVFGRYLRRLLDVPPEELPREIRELIDMESYRVQRTGEHRLLPERGAAELRPIGEKDVFAPPAEELEPLSLIIRELNERFGTDFTERDRVSIQELEARLVANEALRTVVSINPPENARLTFDQFATDEAQSMAETNFKLYKRLSDDPEFAEFLLERLFERFRTHRLGFDQALPPEVAGGDLT